MSVRHSGNVTPISIEFDALIEPAKFRGHAIEMRRDGAFYYVDNGKKVSEAWTSRPCGFCGKHNTPEGYDGCIGEIPGAINACCGHGNAEEAYVQYSESERYAGEDALKIFEMARNK